MDQALLERKLNREKLARQELELLMEKKSLELFEKGEELKRLNQSLEAEVETRSKRLNAIFKNSTVGIVLGKLDGSFIQVNPAFEQILGFDKDELENKSIWDVSVEDDRDQIEQIYHEIVQMEDPKYQYTRKYKCKNGTIIWGQTHISLLKAKNKHPQVLAIIDDVTDQRNAKKAQEELLKSLERANQELKDFAYVVSHDLKAPLRAIGSLSDWLIEDYQDKLDEKGAETLGLLKGRVNRMGNLIDGILNYSKAGTKQGELIFLDTKASIEEAINFIEVPKSHRISFSGNFPKIQLNPVTFQQVFLNLISNSIKYMDKEGGKTLISYSQNDSDHIFEVSDNGPGIPAEYSERIFHIFQTLNPRDEIESTGIGLSIVKKIVLSWGGDVVHDPTYTNGAKFILRIPKLAESNYEQA